MPIDKLKFLGSTNTTMPTTTRSRLDAVTEYLVELVSIPSVTSDHEANYKAIDWVENQLAGLPLTVTRFEHNGAPSLVATTPAVKDPKNPRLWLSGHIDVVPGTKELFEPQIRGHIMTGRGVYDMKSAIAVFIALMHEVGDDLAALDLGLMITSDEETSGKNGVGWLTAQGYRGQAVLLPDSLKTWQLETGAKGASFWRFTAYGQEAHGSRIWEGDNAVERLLNFIGVLRAYTVTEPCGDPKHMHHTLNIGKLSGGIVVNAVPYTAEAHVDIRITPDVTLEEVEKWVKDTQDIVPGVEAEQLPMQAKPSVLPHVGPVELFARITEEHLGRPLEKVFAHGGTDARWFADVGVPVITVNPTGGGMHAKNEWVDLKDLALYYDVVRQFVTEWSK